MVDKSVTFHGFLHQLGVETSSDLRCMWPSGQAMEVGRLDAEDAFALVLVYTRASKLSKTAQEEAVAAMVDERNSSIRQNPVRGQDEEASTSIPSKLRRIIAAGGPSSSSAPVLEELAALDPHVREAAVHQTKLDAMFQFVLENLLDLKELGLEWSMLRDLWLITWRWVPTLTLSCGTGRGSPCTPRCSRTHR